MRLSLDGFADKSGAPAARSDEILRTNEPKF